MNEQKAIICEAHAPSDDSLFWLDVGREMIKGSVSVANDVAKQLVTLSTALISAYLGAAKFLGLTAGSSDARLTFALPIVFWLLSITSALCVIMPKAYEVNMISPDEIKTAKQDAIDRKRKWLICTAALFITGIIAVSFVMLYA